MNGAYEYAESFRDLVQSKKNYFNPSFAFNISDDTQIIVEADYLYNYFTPDFGIGSITDNSTGISTLATQIDRRTFFRPIGNIQEVQQATTDVIVNHKFNDKWTINSVIAYQNYTRDYFSTERVQWAYNSAANNFNPNWSRPIGRSYNEQNYTSAQINVNGEFKTGKIVHKILIGADGDLGQADTYAYKIDATTPELFYT